MPEEARQYWFSDQSTNVGGKKLMQTRPLLSPFRHQYHASTAMATLENARQQGGSAHLARWGYRRAARRNLIMAIAERGLL